MYSKCIWLLENRSMSVQLIFDFIFHIGPIIISFCFPEVTIFFHGLAIILLFYEIIFSRIHIAELRTSNNCTIPSGYSHPVIRYYRAFVMMCVCCAIFAVDFQIFPRRFAKTETFGTSLMDIGSGTMTLCNGMAAGFKWMYHSKSSYTEFWRHTVAPVTMLFALGITRSVVLKLLNYHEQVIEYGVHWNFFITLAGVQSLYGIILYIVQKKIPCQMTYFTLILFGLFIAYIHHYFLSHWHFDSYILSSERADNFISMNKEGIFSLAGYLSLYFLGAAVGRLLFMEPFMKQLTVLSLITLFSWIALLLASSEPSRRIVNVAYIAWILSCNCFILFGLFLIQIQLQKTLPLSFILEATASSQLVIFLAANLLTGVFNISMENSQNARSFSDILYILVYMVLLSSLSVKLLANI